MLSTCASSTRRSTSAAQRGQEPTITCARRRNADPHACFVSKAKLDCTQKQHLDSDAPRGCRQCVAGQGPSSASTTRNRAEAGLRLKVGGRSQHQLVLTPPLSSCTQQPHPSAHSSQTWRRESRLQTRVHRGSAAASQEELAGWWFDSSAACCLCAADACAERAMCQ
jgi:hypothetical protein